MAGSKKDMVRVSGGEFAMGSNDHYPDEGPARRAQVGPFRMDAHQVTNAKFAEFVADTGHVTVAEVAPNPELYPGAPLENLVPGSLVFEMTEGPVDLRDYSRWWRWTPGADWRHPTGPDSNNEDLVEHPVTHVAYPDALAYAKWADKELPTEAEWEFAARGGLDGAEFVWGNEDHQESAPQANTWQGKFPYENTSIDGWVRTSPVGSYPPNGHGLFDMSGNVWEWTRDWYARSRWSADDIDTVADNPTGGPPELSLDPGQPATPIPRKVVKGGSHLCTIQYCYRYRPAARQAQMIDTSMSHLGFRCIVRDEDW